MNIKEELASNEMPNREIEFRGLIKGIDAKNMWAYGSLLVVPGDRSFIYLYEERWKFNEDEIGEYLVEVIPESVGQYTVLKDKSHERIYVRDILDCDGLSPEMICKSNVVFEEGGFWLDCGECLTDFLPKSIKIIGNTFENPELLEGSNGT